MLWTVRRMLFKDFMTPSLISLFFLIFVIADVNNGNWCTIMRLNATYLRHTFEWCGVYLLYIMCFNFAVSSSSENKIYYKVSMVASGNNPGRPALFRHGESPVWNARSQSLLLVDVAAQNVHSLDYNTGKIEVKHIAYGPVNVVMTVMSSKRLLVCVRASVFLMDWGIEGDAALRPITSLDLGQPDNIINEGKVDAAGRFWAGTMGPRLEDDVIRDRGTLYSISSRQPMSPRIHLRPITKVNGLAWALNNSVLYFTDSATRKVEAFDFDCNRGYLSNRRTIIDVAEYGYDEAVPAGIAIDSTGNLWVALMYGGTVLHINPHARHVIYGYKLPVSRTTAVAWGGPNLDELFVTTSQLNVDSEAEPLAGAIFTIRDTGNCGIIPNSFQLENADKY